MSMRRLGGELRRRLCDAMGEAFADYEELKSFARLRLDVDLPAVVERVKKPVAVSELVTYLEARGELTTLFDALAEDYPDNPSVRELMRLWREANAPQATDAPPVPLLLVHSGSPGDARWLALLGVHLRSLQIPFRDELPWSPGAATSPEEGLRGVRLVVVLISPDLLGADPDRCEIIRQCLRRAAPGYEVTLRSLLLRSTNTDGCELLKDTHPVNNLPLEELERRDAGGDQADRYLAEVSRRFFDLLKWTFRLQVKDLLLDRPRDVAAHLDRLVSLLGQAGPYLGGARSVVLDLTAYLLQELLGSGAYVPAHHGDGALVGRVQAHVRDLYERSLSRTDAEVSDRLCAVLRCLHALTGVAPQTSLPTFSPRAEVTLRLLPVWVGAARCADARCADAPGAWERACEQSLFDLPGYLAEQFRVSDVRRPLPLVRVVHCIWLCLNLLREHPPESAEVRRGIAYVLREGMRFLCFGYEDNDEQRRPYYYYDVVAYTDALRVVVAYHASRALGPAFEERVRRLLDAIGGVQGINRYAPSEHLQHVLEVYMAGNFLLNVKLDGVGGTVAESLRGERGERAVAECTQAFALASLLHDVGNLLLPRLTSEAGRLALTASLDLDLAGLLGRLRASVREFAGGCVERLRGEFDEAELGAWPDLDAWLEAQRERPGHGLFGAWYLRDFCEGAGLAGWVVRAATRAVLLHNAVGVRLFVDRDPVAALLVLGDEVYEWDPEQPRTRASFGRWLQVIAQDAPAHEPRDRAVWLEHMRADPSGDVSLGVTGAPWPAVHIELQGPQRLALPIFKLWFRKSLNLGRVVPGRSGFGPAMTLTSHGDASEAAFAAFRADLASRSDLQATLDEWRRRVELTEGGRRETITLRSFGDDPAFLCALQAVGRELNLSVRDD